jgi:hypothetical protein
MLRNIVHLARLPALARAACLLYEAAWAFSIITPSSLRASPPGIAAAR